MNCARGRRERLPQSWFQRIGGCNGLALRLVLAASLTAFSSGAATQLPPRKNVLIVTEVGLSHGFFPLVTEKILSRLRGEPDYQVEFYFESLDSVSFTDDTMHRDIRAWLARKYRNLELHAIVAVGLQPILMLSDSSSTLFPDIPIVFCGTIMDHAGNPELDPRFTGSWLKLEPAKTIEAALRLFPETRHVVVVGGASDFDRANENVTRAGLHSYQNKLDITYLTGLEMNSLLDRLRRLPDGSIVLYTSFFRDSAGHLFVNATMALPLVAGAANAPVFGMSDTYMGHGIVGGCVMSYAEQGRIAAHILAGVLGGQRPQDIPIVTGTSVCLFDWRELQRWGIKESSLPAGSTILFREPALWERARGILLAGTLSILVLASLTAYLLFKQKQLRLAREAQSRLSGMLIDAQEKERARIASELHDDFSQRLALLSLDLETAAGTIPASPEEAARQLHRLMDSAGEIGADLHALSRRLHPSTLESLGLVPGLSALCREFTAQQGIAVDFAHAEIPRSVPHEAALCLFRIVQEGLRNLKKHSGASNAQVDLGMAGDTLHVSVCDRGVGFNLRELPNKAGLGIRSMAEHAHLLGGRFSIHSEPQKGTRIDAWVPLQPQAGAEIA